MPKRKPAALLQKLSILMKISIFLAKLKKPIIPILVSSLKKTRKLKKFKPLKHYSYVKEYELSPSSTPLIQFHRKARNERFKFKRFYFSKCLGMVRGKEEKERWCLDMGLEPLPCSINYDENAENNRELMVLDLSDYSSTEFDSVDERAERFIQKFYEDMRRQRQESHFLLEM